jgi:hypothetical protein
MSNSDPLDEHPMNPINQEGYPEVFPHPDDDPFASDAPIHHLLSISTNPRVKDLSDEDLIKLVQRIRTIATSPQTMSAKINSESRGRRSKPLTPEQLRRKEILDSL